MKEVKTYKVAIIHHSADLDGIFSGALAYLFWDNVRTIMSKNKHINVEFDLIGYNYGKDVTIDTWLDPFENGVCKYDYVQFIDITPPMFWMEKVKELIIADVMYVEIFDHHKAPYDEIIKNFGYIMMNKSENFNYYYSDYCAAYIYFSTFYDLKWFKKLYKSKLAQTGIFRGLTSSNLLKTIEETITKLITLTNSRMMNLVDSYDTWKWKISNNSDGLAINEYFLLFKPETDGIENAIQFLITGNETKLESIITKGYELIRIKEIFAKNQKHSIIEIDSNPTNKLEKFIIINDKANTYSIDVVESKILQALSQPCSGPENDAELERYVNTKAIIFYNNIDFVKGTINLSFRHVDKSFNVSDFAKYICQGNAGGHFGAAGGSMRLDMFSHLIQTNNKTEKIKTKQN